MTLNLKELQLNKSYNFNIVIEDDKDSFAGKLYLSPEKITLKIMGEESDQRRCSIGVSDLDNLVCTDLNKEFILHDLKIISGRFNSISHSQKAISYFEIIFDVGYVLFCPSVMRIDERFTCLSIHSETISEWIGYTETQSEITKLYEKREPISDDPSKLAEFVVDINELGRLGISYNLSMYSSSKDFKSGILFPPSLFVAFTRKINANEIKRQYDKIYNLFAFLTGDELLVDKVDVTYMGSGFTSTRGSLYYPSRTVGKRNKNGCVFYPLGKDVRFGSLKLPSMSMDVFNKYFSLSENDSEYWQKYLRYKRMGNVEERFLGFFRILENLCFKKKNYLDGKLLSALAERIKPYLIKKFKDKKNVTSFIKGLPRYNSSKYNTEKCLQDFFVQIPTEISRSWKFQKEDIHGICQLRNDITHANDYYVSESDIEDKAKFIEILLIFSLCSKIGINLAVTAKLINRLKGYHLAIKREA